MNVDGVVVADVRRMLWSPRLVVLEWGGDIACAIFVRHGTVFV